MVYSMSICYLQYQIIHIVLQDKCSGVCRTIHTLEWRKQSHLSVRISSVSQYYKGLVTTYSHKIHPLLQTAATTGHSLHGNWKREQISGVFNEKGSNKNEKEEIAKMKKIESLHKNL